MSSKNSVEAVYPLSHMQQGMLFHAELSPDSGMYVNQSVYRIHGRLDVTRFLAAWQQLSDRHAVLRTAFVMQDGEWRQVAFHRAGVPLVRADWRDIDAAGQELKLQEWLRTVHQQGFPPKQAPLLRLALFQVADDSYLFIFSN